MNKVAILKSGIAKTGGLEKYTFKLAQGFAQKGSEVTILTTGPTDQINLSDPRIHIKSLGPIPKWSFWHLRQFDQYARQWIAENKPGIIFGMDRNTQQTHYRAGNGVHAEYLAKRAQQESFLKRLSFFINPLHRAILSYEKATYENPDLKVLFTNSNMVKAEVLNYYRIAPEKIQVVHNGVEWSQLASAYNNWEEEQVAIMRELGLDPSAFQFLFIGNGYARKGLPQLMEGLTKLKWNNFQLSVVGYDKNIAHYKHLAEALKLGDKVKFFGLRKDIYQFYQMADALVIPSLYDPFANVTVEALALGIFVVSSTTNGGHEVLTAETGVKIENPFDPDSIAHALQVALSHPKTPTRARQIRDSVKYLDFTHQIDKLVTAALNT